MTLFRFYAWLYGFIAACVGIALGAQLWKFGPTGWSICTAYCLGFVLGSGSCTLRWLWIWRNQ